MKRADMLAEIQYVLDNGFPGEGPPPRVAARILAVIERYGMEPPIILKKGESDGPGEGQLVNEWEDQ